MGAQRRSDAADVRGLQRQSRGQRIDSSSGASEAPLSRSRPPDGILRLVGPSDTPAAPPERPDRGPLGILPPGRRAGSGQRGVAGGQWPFRRGRPTGPVQRRRLRWRRWGRRLLLAGLLVSVLLGGVFLWLWQTTPNVADLSARVQAVDQQHQAPYTPLGQVSPLIQQALIVTEDEHFYQHHGIDTLGLLRAGWDDLLAWQVKEGGSTLTEQLAKNAYLGGDDHTVGRKLEDLVLALKIEQRYTKGQILEFYLNLVYFGDGAYGIGAASAHYFGRPPAQVDLAQAAVLVGLVQAPSADDPLCHPAAARARQQAVLGRLLSSGAITAAQAAAASAEVLPFWAPGAHPARKAFCGV